jgi:hypothetical protein
MMCERGWNLEDYPPAPSARRAMAVAVDAVMIVGFPLIMVPPSYLLLIVTAVWVIPLFILSIVGALLMWRARRQPNGDRLTPGQMVAGLTVLRSDSDSRVVIAAEGPAALQPNRSRTTSAQLAFVLTYAAAVGIWGTAAFVVANLPTPQ